MWKGGLAKGSLQKSNSCDNRLLRGFMKLYEAKWTAKECIRGLVIIFLIVLGHEYYLQWKEKLQKPQNLIQGSSQPIKVIVAKHKIEGISNEDIDASFAKEYGVQELNNFKSLMQKNSSENNLLVGMQEITGKSGLFVEGNKNLIVTTIDLMSVSPYALLITGIDNNELIRFGCISTDGKPVLFSQGVCHDRMIQTFGVALGGASYQNH